MYTNINTTHALSTLKSWLDLHRRDLPTDYPFDMILDSTNHVMQNNIFQFDDTYWLQKTGTAMGSSLAVTYATIYFSYHEETQVLPTLGNSIITYGRLIDDTGMILDTAALPSHVTLDNLTTHLSNLLKFGDLTWEVEQPSKSTNFLDLSIHLNPDGTITTRTFIKPMNLHLYIPPRSAHPKGVLKSLIHGNLYRFWTQNSDRQDYITTTSAFFGHLTNRGYEPNELLPLFQEAAESLDKHASRSKTKKRSTDNTVFIHWEYHPRDIPRQAIRQAFYQHLSPDSKQRDSPASQQ